MRKLKAHAEVSVCIEAIIAGGGHVAMLDTAIQRLIQRQRLSSPHFSDHELTGKLKGLRSAIVGSTAENRTVVMIYKLTTQSVEIFMVDEHDAAYRRMIRIGR